jgi:hypothetical protein
LRYQPAALVGAAEAEADGVATDGVATDGDATDGDAAPLATLEASEYS